MYVEKYHELEYVSRQRFRLNGVDSSIYEELLQLRNECIWLRYENDRLRSQLAEQALT